jgi:hypothetical protein
VSVVGLQVQRPANDWEFYICAELSKRMKNRGKSEVNIFHSFTAIITLIYDNTNIFQL